MATQALPSYRNAEELAGYLTSQMPQWNQRDEAALRAAAENKYTPIYNSQVEGANQQQQQSDLALAQQIERLMPAYQRQVEDINASTARGQSTQNRQALSRGMQRSSFNNATLGNIANAGTKQVSLAGEQLAQNTNQINAQRTQLAQQLAQTLNRLGTDKQMNIAGYMDDSRQQDFTNAMGGFDALSAFQLELARQQYQRDALAQDQAQFEATMNARSGGGGSGSRSSSRSPAQTQPTVSTTTSRKPSESAGLMGTIRIPGQSMMG